MNRILIVFMSFVAMLVCGAASADASTAHTFARAQHLLSDSGDRAQWDGRYGERYSSFCVETFNGTNRDIREWGHGMPPGFYILVCENGQYYINDGMPFRNLKAY